MESGSQHVQPKPLSIAKRRGSSAPSVNAGSPITKRRGSFDTATAGSPQRTKRSPDGPVSPMGKPLTSNTIESSRSLLPGSPSKSIRSPVQPEVGSPQRVTSFTWKSKEASPTSSLVRGGTFRRGETMRRQHRLPQDSSALTRQGTVMSLKSPVLREAGSPIGLPPALKLSRSQVGGLDLNSSLSRIGSTRLLKTLRSQARAGVVLKQPTVDRAASSIRAVSPVEELTPEERAERDRKLEMMAKLRRIVRQIGQASVFSKSTKKTGVRPKMTTGEWFSDTQKGQKTPRRSQVDMDHVDDAWQIMEKVADAIALPTAGDLAELPENLRETFRTLAMRTLRKFLYPRLLLMMRRRDRRKLNEAHANVPPLTPEILQRQQMFAQCPRDVLIDVCQALVLMNFEAGEYLIHEDENAGSGIFFICTGKVDVLKKKDRKNKSLGPENTTKLVTLPFSPGQVVCVGEFAFLTEEPRMASCKAVTMVDCWVMRKNDFATFIKRLQNMDNVFSAVVDVAFQTRKNTMHMSYPMNREKLCVCPIFAACPDKMVHEYLDALKPYAVPKDFVVLKSDTTADKILFLQNGRVAVRRLVGSTVSKPGAADKQDTHVQTLEPPAVFSDTAVLHGTSNGDTIQALGTCDFWMLSKSDFDLILRRYPGVEASMMQEARWQRQTQLATQQNLFKDCVRRIPFLGSICPREAMRGLVRLFEARVCKPMSVLCSTSSLADKVIIVYKGRVRVGDHGIWRKGECAGHTCLIPHRWAEIAVTLDVVECLEIGIHLYEEFLKIQELYHVMLEWIKRLLFPLAFPAEEVVEAQAKAVNQDGDPMMRMYPRSLSSKVSLCEPGFRSEHSSKLLTNRIPSLAERARIQQYKGRPQTASDGSSGLRPVWRDRAPPSSFGRSSKYLWRSRRESFASDPMQAEEDRQTVLRLKRVGGGPGKHNAVLNKFPLDRPSTGAPRKVEAWDTS
eukprot:Hpha_TRINITY_DN18831_c0_g1::TRINITY_DN18831_c0_g1_i1::g.26298::m.26298